MRTAKHCVSVVIADRHPVVLYGLTRLLAAEHGFEVVASCRDGAQCIQAIRDLSPQIALIDITLDHVTGLDVLAAVSAERLSTRVVFLVETVDDLELRIAVARGAYGLILKEAAPDILLYSVRQVASGHRLLLALLDRESGRTRERAGRATTEDGLLTALTHRELQIMRLVSEGLSNKEVGRQLNVSDGTIKVHLHHIYQKLAISNRTALASLVVSRHGATPSAN